MNTRERTIKTQALVLKRREYQEADYLLMVLTPQEGKLSAIAKGARRMLSRKRGQVELYCLTNLVLNKGRDLHIVIQAEMQEAYPTLRYDYRRHVTASHCVELMDAFAMENENNPHAFVLMQSTLDWLSDFDHDIGLVARYFEFQLLRVMGFEPSLFQCAVSGKELTAQDQYFCPAEGGVILPEYTAGRDVLALSLPVFKLLRHFSREKWRHVRQLRLTWRQHKELAGILEAYITYILERRSRSLGMLNHLDEDT